MKVPAFLLISLGTAQLIGANTNCAPEPPATCNPDDCCRTYCLGPTNVGISAPVRPFTCDGDWVITASGFYWNAHMDGLEYAIETQVKSDAQQLGILTRSELIDAEYKNPNFKWDFGFKLGIGYNTTCDGWDMSAVWTHYHGKASSHDEAEKDDNSTLLPIWSDYNMILDQKPPVQRPPLYATDIQTEWNLKLDLIDIELGRERWESKKLTIRPHVGLRIAFIDQKLTIKHKGGSWSEGDDQMKLVNLFQNNEVELENDFKGIGIRGGLDTVWNFGCGWALYGNSAFSILYGRFHIKHDEANRLAEIPFSKTKVLESTNTFRASRFVADFTLGVQWSSLLCDCKYAFAAKLGWENHLFFDQNQLWKVRKLEYPGDPSTEDNTYQNSRGSLDTQGWTLTFVFDF
ncbi:MAG: hypothetical protein KR126chlam3_01071 [Chlamydiae bacterium]|nr:hypothetical protein [Chlamydiota bacterium]